MKRLRKIIISVVFISLVLGTLVPVSYTLRAVEINTKGFNYKELRRRIAGFYAEPDDSVDVVVIGSSAVYRFVNNPYLWEQEQVTSYNYSFPSCSIYLIEDLIDEVKKTQSPKVIILDARKYIMTDHGSVVKDSAQLILKNMKYTDARYRIVNRVYDDPVDRFSNYFDISIYHSKWQKVTWQTLDYADNERQDPMKGWHNIKEVKDVQEIIVPEVTEEKPLNEDAEVALRSVLEKCQEEDITVLMLNTPWKMDEEFQKESNYMKRIVEEYGFNYLDMNPLKDEMGLDFSTDYYDRKHVNVWGSEKVTKYLGEYLTSHYDLESDHNEEIVESWNSAVKHYRKDLEE
ncbi:MAG: hypothetical protein IJP29_06470 [Lachnospiraceae bacterium]|nr:hypothetical protein [Lachnospiraceae bacterium]